MSDDPGPSPEGDAHEHFKPVGTLFILVMFVAALILLWASVYVILISRGVTV
ncbi:MAG: cytochrome c oxidase subunit 2A [Acidimicrobiales bacterium]